MHDPCGECGDCQQASALWALAMLKSLTQE